jgi:hypothetical protein
VYTTDFLPKLSILLRFQLNSWSTSLCRHSSDFTVQLLAPEHAPNIRLWCWFSAHVSWVRGQVRGRTAPSPHAHNSHPGKSTPQSNVPRMLQCGQLSGEITGVFTEIPTSRAQLKLQQHSHFTQKVNHAQWWNNLYALTSLKSYTFSSKSLPLKWHSQFFKNDFVFARIQRMT